MGRKRPREADPTEATKLAVLALAAVLAGCASTRVAPVSSEFEPDARDELELWNQSQALDQRWDEAGFVYQDDALELYLQGIADELLPHMQAGGAAVRVRVLRDPFLNAQALPNGTLYLNMGMLARIENEAQLATLVGHELSHYLMRHSLKSTRSAHNRKVASQVILGTLAVITALGGDPAAAAMVMDAGGDIADRIIEARINGYSRELEREADAMGLQAMVAAGYDPREAPQVFRLLLEEEDNIVEPYYYGSHPRLEERLASYEEYLAQWQRENPEPVGLRGTNDDEYGRHVVALLLANGRLDRQLGRHSLAQRTVSRHVSLAPTSVEGYRLLGDLYRRGGHGRGNLVSAAEAFERALDLEPQDQAAHRELGLLYRDLGDSARARSELERYIALEPDAVDRPIIESYLEELAKEPGHGP